MKDSTKRFSDKVENYVKYRPEYPREVIQYLKENINLNKNSIVADVGSGTGKFTELLLESAGKVYAVEPNKEMRNAAEELLMHNVSFCSINGTAEKTNLPDHAIDIITIAQAFHWFDAAKALTEFRRILIKNGFLVLLWNRRIDNTKFLTDYEKTLNKYSKEYNEVNHKNIKDKKLKSYFIKNFEKIVFDNYQEFDFEGVIGRFKSSSYSPKEGTDEYRKAYKQLEESFQKNNINNKIKFNYFTEIYLGKILI